MGRRCAFTLIELLVVLGIMMLLASIVLAALKAAREQARQVACMSNLHQVSSAYLSYAADNQSYLLPCDSQTMQAGAPGDSQGAAIPELLPYAPDSRVFHCPTDDRFGLRSYAVNDFLGGTYPAPHFEHATRLHDVRNCSRTFLFIEETQSPTGEAATGGFVVLPYPSEIWADAPGIQHANGTCMSFVDGHCEFLRWTDARTPTVWANLPFYHTKGNADLAQLQSLEGFGHAPVQ